MKRLAVALVVAAVLATGVAVAAFDRSSGELPSGPMEKPNQHAWGIHAESGVPFTDGFETIALRGRRSAEIVSIEVDGDDGLDTLGFRLVGPDRGFGSIQSMKGWPPQDDELDPSSSYPAIGAELLTWKALDRRGYELLIGHKVDEKGYFVRKGFWVTYAVEGVEYRQYFPAVLAVCNGVHLEKRDCPAPQGWADFPEHDQPAR